MNPSLKTSSQFNRQSVTWVVGTGQKLPKVTKVAIISWISLGQHFFRLHIWCNIHWLSWERKNSNRKILCCIIGLFEKRNQEEKAAYCKEKSVVSLGNTPSHTSMKLMTKVNDLKYELFYHLCILQICLPSDCYLISNFKMCLKRKIFVSYVDVYYETDTYFGALEKSYYIKNI